MKILKKEVIYLNEKEEEAINLLKQLCLAISNQSITYELVEMTENIHHLLTIFSKNWVVKDLNNTCCDEDDEEEDEDYYDEDDEDDEDDDEWYNDDEWYDGDEYDLRKILMN